jgi:hypothetical protein
MLQRARDSAQQELVAQLRATLAELSESNDELRAASAEPQRPGRASANV